MYFKNRQHAGVVLANAIYKEWLHKNAVVVALPRGGIPVARVVAKKLRAPLECISVSKVGTPHNPENSIGAVGENYQIWLNNDMISFLKITQAELDKTIAQSMRDVQHLAKVLRRGLKSVDLHGRSVILVDDGLTTGSSMLVAIRSLRIQGAKEIAVVVPVASATAIDLIKPEADFVFSAHTPSIYGSAGEWYEDYLPVEDEQLIRILKSFSYHEVTLEVGNVKLTGELVQPQNCRGWIVFAHGGGSSRKNRANLKVAQKLNEEGFGTLLFDLLTDEEAKLRTSFFYDIEFLAHRFSLVTRWLKARPEWNHLPIGYFGAGTGAAVALQCCAEYEQEIFSIVSRAGRPDLAKELEKVKCPVLLLVGAKDERMIYLNRMTEKLMTNAKIKVITGVFDQFVVSSSHWFEEKLKQKTREEGVSAYL